MGMSLCKVLWDAFEGKVLHKSNLVTPYLECYLSHTPYFHIQEMAAFHE